MPRQRAPWFRLYSEMIHSKKVRTMGAARFEQWMYLLCLASDSSPRGRLPGIGDIAYSLRWSEKKASEVVTALHKAHFLDLEGGHFWCHDWGDWQFESDANLTPGRASGRAIRPGSRRREEGEIAIVSPPFRRAITAVREESETDQIRDREEPEEDAQARVPFNVFRLCEQFYGRPIGTMEIQSLKDLDADFDADCITHAFREASDLNKKSIRYVRAICERHKKEGCFVDLRPAQAAAIGGAGLAAVAGSSSYPRGYEPTPTILD